MQILEEEKSKLDNFCEQSLKNVSIINDVITFLNYTTIEECCTM